MHKVADSTDGRFRMLFHGTTIHGAQRLTNNDGVPSTGKPELISYYHAGGSITDGVSAVREQRGTLGRVAVVGLGTGSMACFAKAGEHWQFFEIDSIVVKIAKDPTALVAAILNCQRPGRNRRQLKSAATLFTISR